MPGLAEETHAAPKPLRVLALVARFKWQHIDYLHALAGRFELAAAHAGEGHAGAAAEARSEGLVLATLPVPWERPHEVRAAVSDVLAAFQPDVVHVLYYYNEQLTLLVRELGFEGVLVHECRDPLTTLQRQDERSSGLERWALKVSDGQILVSAALRSYFERLHGLELGSTSLVVPHAFARATLAPPSAKLSAQDGETHLALVGTAHRRRGDGRYYVEIIERLTQLGFAVHSHFHDIDPRTSRLYRKLALANPRYRCHPTVSHRRSTQLSELMSRYDLMGVFHELAATRTNEAATLRVCMPTKAVCGWFHGGIPVVCSPHYEGIVELIEEHAIGFVANGWDDLERVRRDRDAIADATGRTLAIRERFSNEWNARRIEGFFRRLIEARRAETAVAGVSP